MEPKMLLSTFILNKYTESKVPEQMLEVVFENASQLSGTANGQERCEHLMFPFARSPLKKVGIKNSKILDIRNDAIEEKEIREMTVDFNDFKDFDWQPGDTIAILPNNASEYINELIELLDLESKADTICRISVSKYCTNKRAKIPLHIPSPTTPREVLRDCINLKSILKKSFLTSLAEYCVDNEEKKFLKCMSSKEGSSFYMDFIIKNGFTLVDILKLCPSCKPPFSLVVEHMLRLLPRPYSIANSPLTTNDNITFIFSTLQSKPGVTTKMLKEKALDENPSLLMYLRDPNHFRYTQENYPQNQILIAIGTGIAPFLGFLQHKQHMMEKNIGKPGITWLFVGTTTKQSLIHREDLLKWQSKNVVDIFEEAFSRSPTAPFHYVQDALQENSKQLVELLMIPETYLYLCADGGEISKSIEICLQNILSKELSICKTDAVNLLENFKTHKKYREDVWL